MKKLLCLALALALIAGLAAPALAAGVSDLPLYWSNVNTSGVTQGEGGYWPNIEVPGSDLYVQAISTYHYN